jgi:hypothetical protein
MKNLVLAVALAGVPSSASARQTATLIPVDDGARDPAFAAYRGELRRIVAKRDVEALLAAIDGDIMISFGDDGGREAFRRQWRLGESDSEIWSELDEVLRLGAASEGEGAFSAPYVYSRWPSELEPFEYVAVVGAGVRLRRRPSVRAPVIASVSYAIVNVLGNLDDPWTEVRLADGRSGFMASRYLRSPIDYRAWFARKNGQWRMTIFLAGD